MKPSYFLVLMLTLCGCAAPKVTIPDQDRFENIPEKFKNCINNTAEECFQKALHASSDGYNEHAKLLFRSSCDMGFKQSCEKEEVKVEEVKVEEEEEEVKVEEEVKKECKKGKLAECEDLAQAAIMKDSTEEAISYYKVMCDNEIIPACTNIGVLLLRVQNFVEAKKMFEHSCNKKYELGCLGLVHLEELKGNHGEARKILNRKCDDGMNILCQKLIKLRGH